MRNRQLFSYLTTISLQHIIVKLKIYVIIQTVKILR